MGTSRAVLVLMPDLRGPAREGAELRSPQTDDLAPLVASCRRGDTVATKTLFATLGLSML